jgi:hypothetical protein
MCGLQFTPVIKQKKKNSAAGCLVLFAAIVFIIVIINAVNGGDKEDIAVNDTTVVKSTANLSATPGPTLSPEEIEQKLHDEWVISQFRLWDGSHSRLVKFVKENMNDPKSFEHVETTYLVISTQEQLDLIGKGKIGDLYVHMKFRGANAFGGTILSEVEAIVEYENNTLTVLNDF